MNNRPVVYGALGVYRNQQAYFEGTLFNPRTKLITRCGHMHRFNDLAVTCARRQAAKLNKLL